MAAFLPSHCYPLLSHTASPSPPSNPSPLPLFRPHPLKPSPPLPFIASAFRPSNPDPPHQSASPPPPDNQLCAGSPIVVVEAPPLLKTAEPMPMMRPNTGLIKPGDAGRIISRRPKDVWAVRFAVGAYLIDRKYFKPLEIS